NFGKLVADRPGHNVVSLFRPVSADARTVHVVVRDLHVRSRSERSADVVRVNGKDGAKRRCLRRAEDPREFHIVDLDEVRVLAERELLAAGIGAGDDWTRPGVPGKPGLVDADIDEAT